MSQCSAVQCKCFKALGKAVCKSRPARWAGASEGERPLGCAWNESKAISTLGRGTRKDGCRRTAVEKEHRGALQCAFGMVPKLGGSERGAAPRGMNGHPHAAPVGRRRCT